jgi:hypothetical protein
MLRQHDSWIIAVDVIDDVLEAPLKWPHNAIRIAFCVRYFAGAHPFSEQISHALNRLKTLHNRVSHPKVHPKQNQVIPVSYFPRLAAGREDIEQQEPPFVYED